MKKRAKRGGTRVTRARNPFALHARRRRAAVEPSRRAYRRRAKHSAKPEGEQGE